MASEPGINTFATEIGSIAVQGGIVGAVLLFVRWLLTLVGGRQDARIAKLEAAHESDTSKMITRAHALLEVMLLLERRETSDPAQIILETAAIHRARVALIAVFTLSVAGTAAAAWTKETAP
jgi:hypothetical protein